MEEKVLIKSKLDSKASKVFMGIVIVCLVLAVIFLIVGFSGARSGVREHKAEVVDYWYDNERNYCERCYDRVDYVHGDINTFYQTESDFLEHFADEHYDFKMRFQDGAAGFIIHYGFIGLAGLTALLWFILSHSYLIVTDKNVQGRTIFGKKVILPINMISAYSTSKILSIISVSTASGWVRFSLIENNLEMANVLREIISENQSSVNVVKTPVATKTGNNYDDLLKLKNLLDNGIISQEEFDAKKKDLLGL